MAVNNKDYAIKVDHVTMKFNMASERVDGLKEYVIKMLKHQLFYREFIAVDDVSFEVKKGEVFGIVGTNGSGKSTMLKIVSGILEASSGTVETVGKIAPLIELGAGFDGDLTARENIFLNGAVLGYDKEFIEEKFTSIVDFAELWDFLDMPIKNYSSGMVARIAFAIATVVKPDILIVDEILAVGDFLFQQKCENRIRELMAGGTTVLIVSHSIDQIEKLCDRVLWIEKSKPKMIGPTFEVCNAYRNMERGQEEQKREYQTVYKGKCHLCGEMVEFHNEPGMTYHTEAFCSHCGVPLRTSDAIGSYLEKSFKGQIECLLDAADKLASKKIMYSSNQGVLFSFLKQFENTQCLQGTIKERCKQLESIEELELSKESLDLIIVEELLMYVKNPQQVLDGLASLLKPGGMLLATVPIYEGINTRTRTNTKKRIYRNGVLVQTDWGMDAEKYVEHAGMTSKMICCRRWYKPAEQPDVDKTYEQCCNMHPYYYYKFNSWVLIGTKR